MNTSEHKPDELQENSLAGELGWLGAGSVLPLTSISFYDRAVRRPPMMALIFLLAFGLALALLTSIDVTRNLSSLEEDVRQALVESEFPTITIEDGEAQADVPQPYTVFHEAGTVMIVDTTGQIQRLSADQYDQGFLLTQTELHVLNQGGDYQVTDLNDLNLLFGQDTLIINAETLSEFAGGFASIFSVIAFVALLIWHILGRLVFVSLMALVIWLLASTYWQGVKYAQVWIVGAYASVAALYVTYLLSRLSISICMVQSFFLAGIMLAVTYALRPQAGEEEPRTFEPFKLRFAWIGLPLVLLLAYDLFFRMPHQEWYLLGMMLGLVAILVGMEYFGDPAVAMED